MTGVRSFGDVQGDLAHAPPRGSRRVHLVAAPVAELRRASRPPRGTGRRTPRRPWPRTRESAISENPPRRAPGGSRRPAVHHVATARRVRAGLRVRDGGSREKRQRGVVVHLAVADDAAVAMRRVLVEANVRHDGELRDLPLQAADRFLQRAGVVPGLRARFVLALRGVPEEDDGGNAEGPQPLRLGHRAALGDSRWTPGSDEIGSRTAAPWRTKSGATSCSVERRVSRTRPRRAGVRRNRLRRTSGKPLIAAAAYCPAPGVASVSSSARRRRRSGRRRQRRSARRRRSARKAGWTARAPRRASLEGARRRPDQRCRERPPGGGRRRRAESGERPLYELAREIEDPRGLATLR